MQINNSLTAIKNGGGFLPKGPGNGELKRYIPEAYADFYFAALTEEFGLYGVLSIIGLYLMLFFRIIKVALKSKDEYVLIFENFALFNILIICLLVYGKSFVLCIL